MSDTQSSGGIYDAVVTQNGGILLADAMAKKGELDFTKISVGKGYLPAGKSAMQMTAMSDPVKNITQLSKSRTADRSEVVVEGTFTNADVTTGFYYREYGIFAKVTYQDGTSSEETLYIYGNAGDSAEFIPAHGGSIAVTKAITNQIYVGGETKVTLQIADGLTATKEELDAAVDALEAELALKIPTAQKGVASGVATLDTTGKVPAAQLPQLGMTAEEVQTLVAAGQDVIFSNVAVLAASWTATTAYTYAKFQATISLAGVTAAMDAEVFFSANDADSGMFSGGGVVNDGSITLLAIKQPTANITIPKIRFMKGVTEA